MTENPRLLHITASMQRGGAEHCLFHLVRGLRPRFDQQVICFRDDIFVERIRALGVCVHLIPYGPLFLWRLYKKIREIHPDCIHALLWSSGFVARVLGALLHIPVVYAVHSPVNNDGYDSWLRLVLDRWTMSWADQVVAVSVRVHTQCVALRYAKASTIICNGIDANFVREHAGAVPATRAALSIPASAYVIGTVGRLVPLKNQRLLIDVLARMRQRYPHLHLLLVGDGPLRCQLHQEAERLRVAPCVHFLAGDAYRYYPLFDVFVLPSAIEGLSMALLEALSCGVPAVVASTTATHDVIELGVNGLLFSPDNLAQLEEILGKLIHDAHVCKKYAAAGMQTIDQRFSLDRVLDEYTAVFRKSINKI